MSLGQNTEERLPRMIEKIVKRDGREAQFHKEKIAKAVYLSLIHI